MTLRPHRAAAGAAAALLLAAAQAQAQPQPQDPALARNLAATCANCHGTNGNARGEMKPLAGLQAETIVALMAAYKSGTTTGTIMQQIAKGYTDEQIKLIAAHFAAQKPAK
jgi:cytochrome subunit of sulfide dehydrogenase